MARHPGSFPASCLRRPPLHLVQAPMRPKCPAKLKRDWPPLICSDPRQVKAC